MASLIHHSIKLTIINHCLIYSGTSNKGPSEKGTTSTPTSLKGQTGWSQSVLYSKVPLYYGILTDGLTSSPSSINIINSSLLPERAISKREGVTISFCRLYVFDKKELLNYYYYYYSLNSYWTLCIKDTREKPP